MTKGGPNAGGSDELGSALSDLLEEFKSSGESYGRSVFAASLFSTGAAPTIWTAHRHRLTMIKLPQMPRWFRAIDELLSALGLYYLGFRKSEQLSSIAFLIERAIRDFQAVIELSLSGLRGAAFDTVRDVMEIEYLLNDFYHEPLLVAEWLSADTRKLKQKFQPIQLRKRQADRLGINVEELRANADYKIHSETLHVNTTQHQAAMKGVHEFHESLSLFPMYELFFHGDQILHVLTSYQEQLDEETLAIMHDVSLDTYFIVANEIREELTRIQESMAD